MDTEDELVAVVQPLVSGAQLFSSGVEYSFNTSRMIFNKVDYAVLRRNDGTLEAIDDEKLYQVVTGMYAGQMDERYAKTDGRKVVYSSLNPVKLLTSANKFTYILLAVILMLVLIVMMITRTVIRRVRKRK